MVYRLMCQKLLNSRFEVDSTESIWYNISSCYPQEGFVLKLTPQSQYGISTSAGVSAFFVF